MNILIANHHLRRTGGTENYSFALIEELIRQGHQVEYFTFKRGRVSKKIEALGVPFMKRKQYDLILANHKTTIQLLHRRGFIIQTCHGMLPPLEQPSKYADACVSVTREVHNHLKKKGVDSTVIHNGIDCERFSPRQPLHQQLTCVLSLCQSDDANTLIEEVCNQQGIRFLSADKAQDNIWHLEELINKADLVVGIGRSLYDAMACGRTVVSFDKRKYSEALGDGYLDARNVVQSLAHNCSGRGSGRTMDAAIFAEELRKYKAGDGAFLREFALQELNIQQSVHQYLTILEHNGHKKARPDRLLRQLYYRVKGRFT